jgi:hypothetical protein
MLIPIATIRGDPIMALISCPQCKNWVYDNAPPCPCPKCGYHIAPGESTPEPPESSRGKELPIATGTGKHPLVACGQFIGLIFASVFVQLLIVGVFYWIYLGPHMEHQRQLEEEWKNKKIELELGPIRPPPPRPVENERR